MLVLFASLFRTANGPLLPVGPTWYFFSPRQQLASSSANCFILLLKPKFKTFLKVLIASVNIQNSPLFEKGKTLSIFVQFHICIINRSKVLCNLTLYISILDLVVLWMLWLFLLLFKTWCILHLVDSSMTSWLFLSMYGIILLLLFFLFLLSMWMLVSILVLSSFWCCQRGRELCKVQVIFFCKSF